MRENAITLILIFLLAGHFAVAQTVQQGKIRYTAIAGINLAGYQYDKETSQRRDNEGTEVKRLFSYRIGALATYPLRTNIAVQTGLILSGKGDKYNWSRNVEDFGTQQRYSTDIELPVNLLYSYGNLYAGAGPYIGYSLSGKEKDTWTFRDQGTGELEEAKLKDDLFYDDTYQKRFDYGINLTAGYRITKAISVSLGYGLGLNNLYKRADSDDYSYKNRVFSVSAGYSF